MAKKKKPTSKKLKRAKQVKRLRKDGDPRWKKAVRADLTDLAEDDEGVLVLAAAIKALLRE